MRSYTQATIGYYDYQPSPASEDTQGGEALLLSAFSIRGARQEVDLETTSVLVKTSTPGGLTTPAHMGGVVSVLGFITVSASAIMTSFPLGVLQMCLFAFRLDSTVVHPIEASQGVNTLSLVTVFCRFNRRNWDYWRSSLLLLPKMSWQSLRA